LELGQKYTKIFLEDNEGKPWYHFLDDSIDKTDVD
jgi:hypothetical protein